MVEAGAIGVETQKDVNGSQKMARLGFGCAGLMGRLDRRQSLSLLSAAFDAGITHFDTARLYGYGEAESVLGKFVIGRRGQVTLTTKVGILPPQRSLGLTLAKSLARRVATLHSPLRAALRARAQGMVLAGSFDTPSMERSLETSLRELRTDHVDILLLHECGLDDLSREPILGFMERCRTRGLTKRFGIAADVQVARAAVASNSPLAAVLQFPSSAFDDNIALLDPSTASLVITHSALGLRFAELRSQLARQPEMARRWADALGFDPVRGDELGLLFIATAVQANRDGVVLFSSTDPKRIRLGSRLVQDSSTLLSQATTLAVLVRAWCAAGQTR